MLLLLKLKASQGIKEWNVQEIADSFPFGCLLAVQIMCHRYYVHSSKIHSKGPARFSSVQFTDFYAHIFDFE